MFLRKLLAGFAVASLLLMLIVCVFWWRSFRHVDHFSFPGFLVGQTRADVTSSHGTLMVIATQQSAALVHQQASFYRHAQVAKACLLIPALWVAVFIRTKLLPYRPGRVPSPPRGKPASS